MSDATAQAGPTRLAEISKRFGGFWLTAGTVAAGACGGLLLLDGPGMALFGFLSWIVIDKACHLLTLRFTRFSIYSGRLIVVAATLVRAGAWVLGAIAAYAMLGLVQTLMLEVLPTAAGVFAWPLGALVAIAALAVLGLYGYRLPTLLAGLCLSGQTTVFTLLHTVLASVALSAFAIAALAVLLTPLVFLAFIVSLMLFVGIRCRMDASPKAPSQHTWFIDTRVEGELPALPASAAGEVITTVLPPERAAVGLHAWCADQVGRLRALLPGIAADLQDWRYAVPPRVMGLSLPYRTLWTSPHLLPDVLSRLPRPDDRFVYVVHADHDLDTVRAFLPPDRTQVLAADERAASAVTGYEVQPWEEFAQSVNRTITSHQSGFSIGMPWLAAVGVAVLWLLGLFATSSVDMTRAAYFFDAAWFVPVLILVGAFLEWWRWPGGRGERGVLPAWTIDAALLTLAMVYTLMLASGLSEATATRVNSANKQFVAVSVLSAAILALRLVSRGAPAQSPYAPLPLRARPKLLLGALLAVLLALAVFDMPLFNGHSLYASNELLLPTRFGAAEWLLSDLAHALRVGAILGTAALVMRERPTVPVSLVLVTAAGAGIGYLAGLQLGVLFDLVPEYDQILRGTVTPLLAWPGAALGAGVAWGHQTLLGTDRIRRFVLRMTMATAILAPFPAILIVGFFATEDFSALDVFIVPSADGYGLLVALAALASLRSGGTRWQPVILFGVTGMGLFLLIVGGLSGALQEYPEIGIALGRGFMDVALVLLFCQLLLRTPAADTPSFASWSWMPAFVLCFLGFGIELDALIDDAYLDTSFALMSVPLAAVLALRGRPPSVWMLTVALGISLPICAMLAEFADGVVAVVDIGGYVAAMLAVWMVHAANTSTHNPRAPILTGGATTWALAVGLAVSAGFAATDAINFVLDASQWVVVLPFILMLRYQHTLCVAVLAFLFIGTAGMLQFAGAEPFDGLLIDNGYAELNLTDQLHVSFGYTLNHVLAAALAALLGWLMRAGPLDNASRTVRAALAVGALALAALLHVNVSLTDSVFTFGLHGGLLALAFFCFGWVARRGALYAGMCVVALLVIDGGSAWVQDNVADVNVSAFAQTIAEVERQDSSGPLAKTSPIEEIVVQGSRIETFGTPLLQTDSLGVSIFMTPNLALQLWLVAWLGGWARRALLPEPSEASSKGSKTRRPEFPPEPTTSEAAMPGDTKTFTESPGKR